MLNIAPPQAEADPASQHPLGKSEARKNGHLDVPQRTGNCRLHEQYPLWRWTLCRIVSSQQRLKLH
jgi:hypothetical protein